MSGGTLANSKRMLAKLAEKKEMGEMSKPEIYDIVKMDALKRIVEERSLLEGASDSVFSLRRGSGEYTRDCKIEDLLLGIVNRTVKVYQNNRGTGDVSAATVRDVAEDFSPHSFGEFTVGIYNGKLCIADGHSRGLGLLHRLVSEKLTEMEKKFNINLRFVPESKFLEVYQKRNSSSRHKSSEKINNPDYMFGAILLVFSNILGAHWLPFKNNSKLKQQLIYLVHYFATKYKGGDVSYNDIFGCRKETKNLLMTRPVKAPYQLSDKMFQELCCGIKYYNEVMSIVRGTMNGGKIMDTKPLKCILGSSPLMGLIVADHVSGNNDFKKSAARLASRILKNASELSLLTPCMTHSGGSTTRQTEISIRNILTPVA